MLLIIFIIDQEWRCKDTKVNVTNINEQFIGDIDKMGNFDHYLNYFC